MILSELGQYAQAIQYGDRSINCCEQLIEQEEQNKKKDLDHKYKYQLLVFRAKCQYNLGILYKKINKPKEALTIFGQAIKNLEEHLMFSPKIYKLLTAQQ